MAARTHVPTPLIPATPHARASLMRISTVSMFFVTLVALGLELAPAAPTARSFGTATA